MKSVNANKINRKSGEAEGSAVCVDGETEAGGDSPQGAFAVPESETADPSASLRMTKGRVVAHFGSGGGGWIEPGPTQHRFFRRATTAQPR